MFNKTYQNHLLADIENIFKLLNDVYDTVGSKKIFNNI